MKNLFLTISLLVLGMICSAQGDTTIHFVVEQPPMFPCKNKSDNIKEQQACANKKMLEFVYSQINYPKAAKTNLTEGTVICSFIVEKNGSISNIKIVKSIGNGCDEEVVRIVQSMPKWIAGKHQGKPVRVKFNLPVRFRLNNNGHLTNQIIYNEVDSMPIPPCVLDSCCDSLTTSLEICRTMQFINFIHNEITYPKLAIQNDIQGTVLLRFIVETNGSVTNYEVLNSIGNGCDEEVINVVKSLNLKWKPAIKDNKPVRSYFYLPIRFDVENEIFLMPIDSIEQLQNYDTLSYGFMRMPMFTSDCSGNYYKKKHCANMTLLEFIYDNIEYPNESREDGVEGTVVISFVVEKDGTITDAKVVKSVSDDCDLEALRIINLMPKWQPGMQRGQNVRVQFNFPIRFRLN